MAIKDSIKKKVQEAAVNAARKVQESAAQTAPKQDSSFYDDHQARKQAAPKKVFTPSVVNTRPETKKQSTQSFVPVQPQPSRKVKFVPSTVMGRMTGQTRENTFTPRRLTLPSVTMRETDLDMLSGKKQPPQLQNPRVTEADLAAYLDSQPKMNSRFYDDFNKRRGMSKNIGADSLKAGSNLKRSSYFNYDYPSDDYKDLFFTGIKDNTLRSDLLKFITSYNRNSGVQDRNALWQGSAELAARYKRATGKNFDIAEIGNEYTRAQAEAEQNRRDNYFYRKLEDYYSRTENTDFDTVAGKFADPMYYGTRKGYELVMLNATALEQRIYHYLRKTEGNETADDFLDRLQLLTDQRSMQRASEPLEQLGENHRVLGGVGNAVVGLGKGLAYVDNAGQALGQALSNNDTYRPYNPYTPMTAAVHFSNALKSGVTKDLTGAEKIAADLLLNVGENTVRLALGPAGLYVMGAGAAGETAVNQGLKGETNAGRAFATGTAYGAVEIATEKLPLDNLLKILNSPPTNIKQAIVTLLKNSAVEGGEEAISNIADNIADKIINGDKSEFEQYRNALIQNGISEDKATLTAFLKFYVSDTVTDAAQGAAAGLLMSGGTMAISSGAQYYDDVTNIGQEMKNLGAAESIVNEGLASDAQTGAHKYAQRLQNKQERGRDLTDWNVGRQYFKNVKAIQSEEQFINSLSGIVQTQTHSELYDNKGNELNGQYTGGENSRVDISVSGDTSVPGTAKHEFTHAFKQIAPTAYQAFEDYVINAALETNAEAVNNRMKFLKENYGYSDEVAREEIAAELTGAFNTKAAERIASGNVTLADNIVGAIRTAKAQIRTAYSKGNYENSKGVQLTFEQLNNAEKLWNKALSEAAENGGQARTEATVKYSPKGDSVEAKTIKTQIQENLGFLNTLNTVAVSTYDLGQSVKQVRQRVSQEFRKIGYKVDRQNFGVIDLGEKQINQSLNYLNTDAERAALFTVPQVLKRGVEIQTTDNHKSRDYDTVTIAAPVEINGTRGIQAVVVKKVKGNRYKTHRIVMPDGSTFEFSENKTEATSDKMTSVSESESLSITSDNNIISENNENVKKSVKENEGNQTKTDVRYSIAGEGAKTANIARLSAAQELDRQGLGNEEIWKRTGWAKGLEGKWKFEIDDSKAKYIGGNRKGEQRLSDILEHEGLYKAYPELRDMEVWLSGNAGTNGKYLMDLDKILLDANLTAEEKRTTLLHEVQHAIQIREGFATGAEYDENNPSDYWRTAGEIEAHDVKARADMTADERQGSFPDSMRPRDDTRLAYYDTNNRQLTIEDKKTGETRVINLDGRRYASNDNSFNLSRMVKDIIKEYNVDRAGIDSDTIQNSIREAYNIVHSGQNEDNAVRAWDIASEIGRNIANNAQNIDTTMYDTYRDLRNYIRNTPISISEQDRADISGTDNFNEFRQKNFGSIRLSNSGTPIDIFYQELANMYPNFFDASRETHPADQLNRIEKVLGDIRPTDRGFSDEDIDGMATDIASRIFSAIFEDVDTSAPHTAEDAHNAQAPIENYLDAENNADWDSLMNGQEAQRQEDRQRAERERQEQQRIAEFMRDDTLINAYNSESASRTDKKRFGKEDIVPALKKYGIGFMAREVDKLYPIKSYERFAENQIHGKEKVHFRGKNSPYVMSSNSIDAESRAKYILTEELTDFDANPIGESLADIVGDLSYDDYKDFNTYLKLRHGVEWITGDKSTDKPVFDSKILNDPAAMKAGIKQLEAKHPDFTDLAQRIYKYQADLMKAWLVDTGIITQEQYDTLRKKYPNYVPFFRQDDTPSSRFRPKKGIANQSNPIMEAEGGRQRIYDPIENIMINTSRFVNAAAKNSAMQAIVNIYDTVPGMEQYMAEAVKDPETGKFKLKESGATAAENSTEEHAEPEEYITDMVQHAIKLTDGDIVTVLQNGQKRYFKVFDADFLKAIDNLHPIQVGAVMRAVASATRIFSALATSNNPVFTLASNPIKDTQNAFAQTVQRNPFAVVTAILDAQVEQIKNSDIGKRIGQKSNSDYDGTDAYKKYMAMGGEYASAFSAGRKAMNEALGDIKPEQQSLRAKAKRVALFVPNAYGKVADAIETGPRLGEFKYSNGKAGNDVHQAHFDSKNVTLNFGRSGYVGEKINKFVPFYNPSVQGISMMIQNFKDRPLQTSLRVVAMIAISALTLALNKRNKESEEEYKSASSYLKNNYYLLHMGGGHFFKVPKSQEYGLLPSLVERAVEKYAFDNPDAFYDYTDYISTALLPSIFKAEFPFVDTGSIIGLGTYTSLLENKDFKGSPIVPDYLQDEVPAEQYDDRTSYIARWTGKALGWSPKKIDYVIKSNTGFLGKINESVFHEGEKDYTLGVGTKFSADSYFSTDKPNMFYENKDAADRQAKSYPTADSTYLSKRFAQAQSVLGIINQIYKEDPNSEKGRQTRKAYVNYAGWNKDNPTGLTDEVFDEIKSLYNEDSSVLKLPEVQREIKADGKSYTFDSAQSVMNYQKDLNIAIDCAYREQIANVDYSTMTDSEKAEILSKAKQSAIKSVKQFYIENEGKARMSFGTEDSAVKKPSAAAVREQKEKNEYRETVQSSYMQSVADNYAKVNPDKAGEYDVDSMQIKDIKKDILKNKGYELTGDTKTKVIAAANEKYYADIKKFYSGEANIEDIIGYAANGKPKYSTDNNGKRVYLTGSRYNSDGSSRFDETVEGKIMFRIQDAAQESALDEYAGEITGISSQQPQTADEPIQVSSTRFRSTRRSGGSRRSSGGHRSKGSSGGSGGASAGRGVSVAAANVSENAMRRRALEQITGRGGNPTIAKAIRGMKLEPVKALKL